MRLVKFKLLKVARVRGLPDKFCHPDYCAGSVVYGYINSSAAASFFMLALSLRHYNISERAD